MSTVNKINGISIPNVSVSGFTYNSNIFTINKNDGSSYSATIDTMSGLTVSGILSADTLYVTNEDWTIELIAAQTVDFYAPYNMVIESYDTILSATTIALFDDDVSYTTGNTITSGSKITVSAATATVINLNTTH